MPQITTKVVDGKTYNTRTAKKICNVSSAVPMRSFSWFNEALYRTSKGAFFMVGQGGPKTRWASLEEDRSRGYGAELLVLEPEEARAMMERAGCMPEELKAAGFTVEEA